MNLTSELLKLKDLKRAEYLAPFVPNIEPGTILGIRVPVIRKLYLKNQNNHELIRGFLDDLPHYYLEENIMHAIILSEMKEIDIFEKRLDEFERYLDNWMVTDTLRPKYLAKDHLDRIKSISKRYITYQNDYTKRLGIGFMEKYLIKDSFDLKLLLEVLKIKSSNYYLKMMISWYLATLLAFNYDEVIYLFEDGLIDPWILNKAIQKALESYRVEKSNKNYLKTLKLK